MAVYINGIGSISPQHTFGDVPFLDEPVEYTGNRLSCIEPAYTGWIDARAIRRMSRIIRMGVASAGMALKDAGVEIPDAIITGTAFGCLADTGVFLTKMIENKEQALNPTPFIQSTHNTIGSQVALLLPCFAYNQTYSHGGFSFESALTDALMMIGEQPRNVLVGGVDEITDLSFEIMNRFGLYKPSQGSNLTLFERKSDGFIQGEGASYFLLSDKKTLTTYAAIRDIAMFYKSPDVPGKVMEFLTKHTLKISDIDLLLLGENGNVSQDRVYDKLSTGIFMEASIGVYKHLCGEYQTANAFALWLAAKILKDKKIPATILKRGNAGKAIRRILIYNQYLGHHHSLILLESC